MSDNSAIQTFLLNLLPFKSNPSYRRKRKASILLKILIPFFCLLNLCADAQSKDTLYFNKRWQICEKPFAAYYRFGRIVIDTFWYYTGVIKDYYDNDTLQMIGEYSSLGYREGRFISFYRNGNLSAAGNYSKNSKTGIWEYFYPNGDLHTRVDYAGDDVNFIVLDNIDTLGNVTAKDGTGYFNLAVRDAGSIITYDLAGEFKQGKKNGTWTYYASTYDKQHLAFYIEEYADGVFKKGKRYLPLQNAYESYKKVPLATKVPEPDKFRMTEAFGKDQLSFTNTENDEDLAEYLINRQAPSYNTEANSFEESFGNVLLTLNKPSITQFFREPDKIYNGVISINVSDSGDIEDVEVNGNLTEKEKEYMLFFIKKFKNIHDLVVENVTIDAYHKIYFYTVDFQELLKGYYRNIPPIRMFLFNFIPYDKFKFEVTKDLKKKKRLQ